MQICNVEILIHSELFLLLSPNTLRIKSTFSNQHSHSIEHAIEHAFRDEISISVIFFSYSRDVKIQIEWKV